jgi:tetratricopeptide (TPR) repeat protein
MRITLLCFILLTILSLPGSVHAVGQSTTAIVPAPSQSAVNKSDTPNQVANFSAEPVVIEHMDTVCTMAADGTGTRQMTMAARVQTEAAVQQLGIVTAAFAGSSQRVEIVYVRVRRPDGTTVETPADAAIEMPAPITQQAPFYSDLKQMQIPVRSLAVGDTLEWEIKIVQTKPEAPGQFWGQENFVEEGVVLSQTLELRVPKDKAVTVWSPTKKPVETVEGEQRVYRWTSSQLKPTVGKEADAARELKKKHIFTPAEELDAKEGKLPTVAWTTFQSWQEVGAWYQGLESDRVAPDAEVKAKVAELTAGKTTQEEKAQAVYHYVSTQIRYIGVDFGIGRYQPHHASEVLENQYGDCKDKHTLLAAMLTAIDLHPNAALIGAGVRFNEAVPSPASFNHVITTVNINGKQVWLDSTLGAAPFQALVYEIRDENALVVQQTGPARIERTPANLPFSSFQTMDAVGQLDKEGTSNSRLVLTLRGDVEMVVRAAMRQVSPGQYGQLVQQISRNLGYAGTTSNPEISSPEDTAEPIKMSYDYKREKAGDWPNLKIIPQLAPVSLPVFTEEDPPVQAISLGVPRVETSTSAMKLPDGWGAVLPEAVHAKSAYATYDETYRFEKGTLYAERKVVILQEKVPVADWKNYKKWTDAADLSNEQYVQLVTNDKTVASDGKSTSSATTGNDAAANLVKSGFEEIQSHHLDEAQSTLDQAKSLNAEQPFLWAVYGYLEFSRGEMSAAVADYQKEVSLHPDQYTTYRTLVETQISLGQRKEAEETLGKWVKAQPGNDAPPFELANMLLEDKDAAGAIALLEASIASLPDDKKPDEDLEMILGKAQIKAGLKDKGRATLVALLKTTQSPIMMNDCAYELADAGLELPLAETSARTALEKMAEESKTWTLDEDTHTLRGKSTMLAATWDTMGWILYREGKLDEAKNYLNSAWLNLETADPAEHLAVVMEASGDKNAALMYYEFALATTPKVTPMGVKKAPGEAEKRFEQHMESLRKSGAKTLVQDPQKRLQELRTIPLGAANGLNGATEYRLLLSAGNVERAEKAGDKDPHGAQEMLKKARLTDLWPAGSEAHLMRGGVLNCYSKVCELILEP